MTPSFPARGVREAVALLVAKLTGERAAEVMFDLALPKMEPDRLRGGANWSMENHARSNRMRAAIEKAVRELQGREPTME